MVIRGWARSATVHWKRVVAPHAMRVPIRNLRELLWDETLADGNTQKRFEAWASGKNRDVRFEVDTLIASEMKHGFVPDYNDLSLYELEKEAKSYEEDQPRWAEAIYMGLTESLGVHYNMIDDSGGEFWPLFDECMGAMGRCMHKMSLSVEDRQRRIKYLVGWSTAVFSDFMQYYERELEGLCTDVDDLHVWLRVLDAKLRADDIDDRRCYWAVDKKRIEESRARVIKMIAKSGGTKHDMGG